MPIIIKKFIKVPKKIFLLAMLFLVAVVLAVIGKKDNSKVNNGTVKACWDYTGTLPPSTTSGGDGCGGGSCGNCGGTY